MANSMTGVMDSTTVENDCCQCPGNPLAANTMMKVMRTNATATEVLARDVKSPTQCNTRLTRWEIPERSIISPISVSARAMTRSLISRVTLDRRFQARAAGRKLCRDTLGIRGHLDC